MGRAKKPTQGGGPPMIFLTTGGNLMRKLLIVAVLGLLTVEARADIYSVGQSCQTCSSGKCGPVQQVAHNVVSYVGGVGQAVTAPIRGERRRPVRDAIRSLLGNRCR